MRALLLLLAALLSVPVRALEAFDGVLDFHGFGTLSGARTSTDLVGYRMTGQPNGKAGSWAFDSDSLVGLQVDIAQYRELSATVQVIADRDYTNAFRPRVEWAFIRYDLDPAWQVRAGRLVTPVLAESEYRFTRYAFTPVRVSTEIYPSYPVSIHDGVELRWQSALGGGQLLARGFAGTSGVNVASDAQGRRRRFDVPSLAGGAAEWDSERWNLRAAAVRTRAKGVGDGIVIPATPLPGLLRTAGALGCATCNAEAGQYERLLGGFEFSVAALAVRGRFAPWNFLVELEKARTDSTLVEGYAASLTVTRSAGAFTPYVRASVFVGQSNDTANLSPVGVAALDPVLAAVNAAQVAQDTSRKSLGLGLRWDFRPGMALKGEFARYWFASDAYSTLNSVFDTPPATHDRNWNLVTVNLDFAF